MSNRTTLRRIVTMSGVGLHSGIESTVRLFPSQRGKGLRARMPGGIFQSFDTIEVVATERCTRLRFDDGRTVDTVEHLMAAIAIFRLTDADLEFSTSEAPILDGSALPWLNAFGMAGSAALRGYAPSFRVLKHFEFSHRGARYTASPGSLHYDVFIDFPGTFIERQRVEVGALELSDLADCRTFALESEIAALQRAGLALGGGLHNALVIGGQGPLNPEGFRRSDECVRHKALDLVGDLHLLGAPIIGRFTASRPGHSANNAFLRAMMDNGVFAMDQADVLAA